MASGQTTNFGLNQWAAEDRVLREEFNADNRKIDAALKTAGDTATAAAATAAEAAAAGLKIATGTYVGNFTDMTSSDVSVAQTFQLSFNPKMVFVCEVTAFSSNTSLTYRDSFGMASTDHPIDDLLVLGDHCYTVRCKRVANKECYPRLNWQNATYAYVAIG